MSVLTLLMQMNFYLFLCINTVIRNVYWRTAKQLAMLECTVETMLACTEQFVTPFKVLLLWKNDPVDALFSTAGK